MRLISAHIQSVLVTVGVRNFDFDTATIFSTAVMARLQYHCCWQLQVAAWHLQPSWHGRSAHVNVLVALSTLWVPCRSGMAEAQKQQVLVSQTRCEKGRTFVAEFTVLSITWRTSLDVFWG